MLEYLIASLTLECLLHTCFFLFHYFICIKYTFFAKIKILNIPPKIKEMSKSKTVLEVNFNLLEQ